MDLAKLTRKEDVFEHAYSSWFYQYYFRHMELDDDVEHFLELDNRGPWLRNVREALLLTTRDVAKRMGVNQPAYSKCEMREENESISLATLRKAAKALDCDFIYALRPKQKIRFSRIVWRQLIDYAEERFHNHKGPPTTRANAVAELAGKLMDDALFRRHRQWSERNHTNPMATLLLRRIWRRNIERILNDRGR